MGDGLETMKYYKQASKIRNGASTRDCDLTKDGEIIVGKFVDRERPDFSSLMQSEMRQTLGDRYVEPDFACCDEGEVTCKL
jgi:2-oxoglutarate/2-oxoacid ferredoxin oxidoreductase subunit beta